MQDYVSTSPVHWSPVLAPFEMPVLRRTAERLRLLCRDEDYVSAPALADVVLSDPLATAKVFAHLSRYRSARQITEITSIEGCIVMLGIPNFIRAFDGVMAVEDRLKGRPDALRGLLRVLRRSRRAASFAWRFGVWKHDGDPSEIAISALLHDIAEVLLWVSAPDLALRIQSLQRVDPALRSLCAQMEVLGIALADIQLRLAGEWRLPELFVSMMDHTRRENARVRTVWCAVDIARHSAFGWHNPALPDDYRSAAELLNTTPGQVQEMVDGRCLDLVAA